MCISQGVPIETLCKMMGDCSVQTTQIYAKITNQKVNEDMKSLSYHNENRYELPKDGCLRILREINFINKNAHSISYFINFVKIRVINSSLLNK